MTESDEIEEILMEASAYGLRSEVMNAASNLIKSNSKLRKVDAYQTAYKKLTLTQ